MDDLAIGKAFTLIEPGPVVLVTTHDGHAPNVMTISWTMVLDFTPRFAITTGAWNHSYAALTRTKACVIAIPTVWTCSTSWWAWARAPARTPTSSRNSDSPRCRRGMSGRR